MTAASPARPRLTLALLTLIYVVNFIDRQLIGIVGQPMKLELGLSDTQLGLLGGVAFALFYTVLGLPIARAADRGSRVTIIAISLALWSAMTALCGMAGSFAALLTARIGVGVGEAGCAPPSQSLVADLFPPERRATALSVLSLGIPAGMLIGAVAGGWLAQSLGWRSAFLALGLPGVALAGIVALVLREPVRTSPAADAPPLMAVAATLLKRPAFLHMAAGASLASFAGYGVTSFAVPLVLRRFDLPLGVAASGFGLIAGVGIGLGIGGGGWLSDRLARLRPGAPGLVAAAGAIAAAILFQLALSQPDPLALAATGLIPLLGAHLYFGPTYGVTANSVGPRERATAVAILLMAMNAIGLGLGPLAVGVLSDHFVAAGASSGAALTQALRIDLIVYVWAAIHFLLAARALSRARARAMA
ncbi:MFS transporter [Sphingomonas sp. AP4-R1]|uniref:spinster family MFS transporter n=1 Tax=Sphingomonas sp. AP4-R1 TaxID=2735134 RepID=UPI001493710A|nr:MFS transporter [Sphingomonas sp. AP4-R1]QJU58091.1 MFS transporter [Sphingomonas sp. AP4-R1]